MREPDPLRIMTFNLWRGGIQVDFGQIAAAIRAADADVVGLQEPEGNTRRLADLLGWPFADEGLHLISRYPIYRLALPTAESDLPHYGLRAIALVECAPGAVMAVANVHLASSPYGPAELRAGRDAAEIVALEEATRLAELESLLIMFRVFTRNKIPGFLIGDFNVPSHLDRPFPWPVSSALAKAGFRDSYREIHPDSAARPGITWSPGCPHPRPVPDLIPDRIDFIMAAGASRTLASVVIGESGGPDVDIGLLPWPSDHRAVCSDFAVAAVFPEPLVTVDHAAVLQGDPIIARFLIEPGSDGWRVGIRDKVGALLATMEVGDGSDRRAIAFGTATLAPGEYDAVLVEPDGRVRARRLFWVLDRAAPPTLGADPGAPLRVWWRNAPVNRYDWIGLYRAGAVDPTKPLAHAYTGAAAFGAVTLARRAGAAPIGAGDYELRLMRDDAYVTLATAPLRID